MKKSKRKIDVSYKKEKNLKDCPIEVSLEQSTYINKQMKYSVCKIKCKDGSSGTGFFCYIPFPDKNNLLPVLITNYHVLTSGDVIIGKEIKFCLGDSNSMKSIKISNTRKVYTNEKPYDVTIIEMKKIDGIEFNHFMDLDEQLFENENDISNTESREGKNIMDKIYSQKTVYLIHYPFGKNVKYSLGVIKAISEDGFNIRHLCNSQTGSSGGPLINLINFKIMGIHKGYKDLRFNYNLGTVLNLPIKEFYEQEELKKTNNFEEGGFLTGEIFKTAQPPKIDYNKLTFTEKNNLLKEEKKKDIYTIKDLNKLIKCAREQSLLGNYDNAFEKYSIGILVMKYRQREILNTDKSLREKWENTEKHIRSELDEVIEIMKIIKTFNKVNSE